MLSNGQVTVTTTATKIVDSDGNHKTTVYLTYLGGSNPAYFGDSSVTTSDGLMLPQDNRLHVIELPANSSLYAIIDTGTVTVTYLATA